MSYERLWERLLEHLNEWASAQEVRPGRIEVRLAQAGSARTVEIVMTHDEWDELVTVPYGDFDLAARTVKSSLLTLGEDQRFLVYGTYELVPSSTPELPVDEEDAQLQKLARQHPGELGRWVVLGEDGDVLDELGPPS